MSQRPFNILLRLTVKTDSPQCIEKNFSTSVIVLTWKWPQGQDIWSHCERAFSARWSGWRNQRMTPLRDTLPTSGHSLWTQHYPTSLPPFCCDASKTTNKRNYNQIITNYIQLLHLLPLSRMMIFRVLDWTHKNLIN